VNFATCRAEAMTENRRYLAVDTLIGKGPVPPPTSRFNGAVSNGAFGADNDRRANLGRNS
jgi:hypothetical protein